jgi:tetratricopeptide (TPR) repeat protein
MRLRGLVHHVPPLLALLACAAAASAQPPTSDPAEAALYAAIVERYAAGAHETPAEEISTWSRGRLDLAFSALASVPAGLTLRTGDARALRLQKWMVLLHADAAFRAYDREDSAAMSLHLDVATRLLQGAVPWSEAGRGIAARDPLFHQRWAFATLSFFLSHVAIEEAQTFVQAQLRLRPGDPALVLARGTVAELRADRARRAPILQPAGSSVSAWQQRTRRQLESTDALGSAARDFRAALEAAPHLHEARLRLGRVLSQLDRHSEAAAELEQLRASRPARVHAYLAALFLASAHERAGRPGDARPLYEEALSYFPAAQTPHLALSRLAFDHDRDRAAEWLERMFAAVNPRPDEVADPWWVYQLPPNVGLENWLAALRAELAR